MKQLRRFLQWALLTTIFLTLSVGWAPQPQDEPITVVGEVINGTPDGSVPSELPITLYALSETDETLYETTLTGDGSFRFDGVVRENEIIAGTTYQGVDYFSQLHALQAEETEITLPITIYEPTQSLAAIQAAQVHIFIARADGGLQVGEHYLINNSGGRTYVGAEDPEGGAQTTLSFALPEGATNLRLEGAEGRFQEREGGFSDTEPIRPGTATVEIAFSYELISDDRTIERTFPIPVESMVLLPMGENLALEGQGLMLVETGDAEGWPPFSYAAGPLAAGETLAFTVEARAPVSGDSGVPTEGASSRNQTQETAIGLAALAAALVAAYLLWSPSTPGPIPAQARPVVQAIAQLDADFEAGRLEKEKYQRERRALKRKLRSLLSETPHDSSS